MYDIKKGNIKYWTKEDKNKINTEKFVNQIKSSLIEKGTIGKCLNIEVKFNVDPWHSKGSNFEFKIGEDRLYVVKNIKNFINCYVMGSGEIEFGKGFTYDPEKYCFNEDDKKIMNLVQELYEDDERNNYFSGYSSYNKFLVGKRAYLTNIKAKKFIELMKDREVDITLKGNTYPKVKIVQGNPPLSFQLFSEGKEILLKHNSHLPFPITEKGEYLFFEGVIYKPGELERKAFIPFYNEFKRVESSIIKFEEEDSEKIASYIIPSLKKLSAKLSIDKKLEAKFYEEPLFTKVYLDKDDDMIMATIKFFYGDIQINPLAKSKDRSSQSILVRDIQAELNIVKLFQGYKFQKYGDSFINNEEEKIVDFLNTGISVLQDISEIYYSNSFKTLKSYGSSYYRGGIRLNDNDLLEFDFEIEGVDKKELKNIFDALRQKKKYYRLKKGGFVPLDSKEIQEVGSMIEYLDIKYSDFEKDKIIIPKYNSLYIDESIQLQNMDFMQKNKGFMELISSIKEIQSSDYLLPKQLNKIMRKYQKIGFKWLKTLASCGFGGILADEMGLGKTLQVIAFIASEIQEKDDRPSLVVAPTSLVFNWVSEIEKFYPTLKVAVITGTKGEREELIANSKGNNVIITSYPLIRRDIEEYKKINFKYCFLDEAQQIKNHNSVNARSVKEIKADNCFALTGTPMENSLTELWSIFDFVMPGYLFNHGKFVKKYEMPIIKFKHKKSLEELNKHIKPFILRRHKSEVVKELPPKIEHKIIVDMTEGQKKIYAAYLQNAKAEIDESIKDNGFDKSKLRILSILTRLRQICCDPAVFIENYEGGSGKMLALLEIVEESLASGHRILLFSQFTSVLKKIAHNLDKKKIQHMYLDGQTKMEHRGEMVNEFNEGEGQIFLISLKAGGTGLNLTGADVVIHYDPWWNPAVEEQASDRAHRIGQKKTVEVIKLITRGTIEEKIFELQEKKKEIIANVIDRDNSEEVLISKMSEEELRDILRN